MTASSTAPARPGDQARVIADALREEIVAHRAEAGAVLRQERLAERFGTSRMPVREALRMLEAEGLVVFVPNRGAAVAPLDAAEWEEVCEMRAALEPLALARALPHLTDARIAEVEAVQGELEGAALAAFGALDTRFHLTLYAPCARPRLLRQIAVLGAAADRYLRLAAGPIEHAARSHAEHRALLDACRARDEGRAVALLTAHIEAAGRALSDWLAERRGGSVPGRVLS